MCQRTQSPLVRWMDWCQAGDLFLTGYLGKTSLKFESKCKAFGWRKCIGQTPVYQIIRWNAFIVVCRVISVALGQPYDGCPEEYRGSMRGLGVGAGGGVRGVGGWGWGGGVKHFHVLTSSWELKWQYCKTSSISHTKSQNLNISCLLLQWRLPNPLKPDVKLRMKM